MQLVDSAYEQMKTKMQEAELDLELVTKFFVVISAFERAMKRSEYRYQTPKDSNIHASWQHFSKKIQEPGWQEFLQQNQNYKEAFDFLSNPQHNPRHLTVIIGPVEDPYCDLSPDEKLVPAIQYLRGVRNNLFHGEKMNQGFFIDQSDIAYLKHSLCLLDAFLAFDEELKQKFFKGLTPPESN